MCVRVCVIEGATARRAWITAELLDGLATFVVHEAGGQEEADFDVGGDRDQELELVDRRHEVGGVHPRHAAPRDVRQDP